MNSSLAQLLPHQALPAEIYYKKGSLIRLKFLDKSKIVIFTGKNSFKKIESFKRINEYLKPIATSLEIISVEKEPTFESLQIIAKKLTFLKVDLIIACGGGSVLDSGKIARILINNPKINLSDYMKPHTLPESDVKLKLIAIPTTSGSGAEVSWTVPVIDTKNKIKIPLVSASFIPDTVILDPELTFSLSKNLTASGAIDAFTHALESFCSTISNDFSSQYSIMAGKLIYKFLLKTLEDPNCLEGRENLQYAASFAGIAQNTTSVGAIHALSHTLGAVANIPHGLGNVFFLPPVLKLNLKFSDKPLLFLKEIGFKSLEDFLVWFEKVKKSANLKSKWSEFLNIDSLDQIAARVLEDVCMRTNIYKPNLEQIKNILKETK